MATATVCTYKNMCRSRHVMTVCDAETCDVRKCELRHPKICRFFREYGRCKFNPCSYQHEVHWKDSRLSKEITDKLEKKDREIRELRNLIERKMEKIEGLGLCPNSGPPIPPPPPPSKWNKSPIHYIEHMITCIIYCNFLKEVRLGGCGLRGRRPRH